MTQKKPLKTASLFLALCLGTAGLAGCSPAQSTPPAGTEPAAATAVPGDVTPQATPAAEVAKPEKIKFMTGGGLQLENRSDLWAEEYKNKTGIVLDFTPTTSNEYYQKVELAFASGEEPDVFGLGGSYIPNYASSGALADLTELVAASEILTPIGADILESVKVNGTTYGVPSEYGGGAVTYMRKDWLDAAGKQIPTNYEEFIDVLRAFKELNGEIPFTAPGLYSAQAEMYLREFYQDASPEFVRIDAQWVDGMSQENMKPALERLVSAYQEGLIDMEIITNKTSTCRDKWYAGKVGTFTYWAGQWGMNLDTRLKANVPEGETVAIPAIAETQYMISAPGILAISSTCENVPGVFKYFIEYLHDGAEGTVLFENGVEGLHWELGEDNTVQPLPSPANPDELMASAMIAPALSLTPRKTDTPQMKFDDRIFKSLETLRQNPKQLILQPTSKQLSNVTSDLSALRDKTLASIVLGESTIEDGLAAYQREAENLGIAQILAELNGAQ